uniref:RNA helicase n=1 Tax=Ascaris suum TaxID=6253 RepID=F1KTG1_ASCSU
MDGHRFYSSPNMGSMDQWNRNPAMDGAITFQPNGFRHAPNVYMPRNTNQWSEGASGAATKSWSQQGPRDEHKERELFSGVNSGINFGKYEEIPVEASGSDVPPPCASFDDLALHPWVQENIRKSGYSKPTPVQKYSIPTLMQRRDVMSCAQTGSGKTAAFLIPLINQILRNGPDAIRPPQLMNNGRRAMFPVALILAPTRELAMQTHKEALKFGYRTNITSAILYGGRENYRDQINKLRIGCHILIATPGRLLDVVRQGYVLLQECTFLVLDEADRMLDMGFEPQIRQIVEQNGMPQKGMRVTAMFSATFPKEIQVLAQDFLLPNYVFLAVGRVGSTSENIIQKVLWVEEHEKKNFLMELLDADANKGLTLVFVETKRGANDLAWFLQRNNYNVVPIHGDLKQFERERHLEMFRTGEANVLVATAVAARGLDIPNVKHVINFDLPSDIDEYVHRIGRTGRVGNVGQATSFFNDKNRNLGRDLAELLVESNQEMPEWLDPIAKEGVRSGPRYGQRGKGGRFGGRDHRVQSGAAGFHTSRSVPSFQPNNAMNGGIGPSAQWGGRNTGATSFQNSFGHGDASYGGFHHSASSSSFQTKPFGNMMQGAPGGMPQSNGFDYWTTNPPPVHTGYNQAMPLPHMGGGFTTRTSQSTAFGTWQH